VVFAVWQHFDAFNLLEVDFLVKRVNCAIVHAVELHVIEVHGSC
jgi:hypothetical protein